MTVLMSNSTLGVRRAATGAVNSHGEHTSVGWAAPVGMHPGMTREGSDGIWTLGVDPSLWPVRVGDLIVDALGQSWVVQTAALLTNSEDSTVNWVRCTALRRSQGGTEPGGSWFVARYTDLVEAAPAEPGVPVAVGQGAWTGYGPPPVDFDDFRPGDEYLDLNTGIVYELG